MNTIKKILPLTLLLITISSALAMEQTIEEKQDVVLWGELETAAVKKNFKRYFELLLAQPLEKQKRLCRSRFKGGIHFAAEQGNTEALKILLDLGVGIEDRDLACKTPLLYAAENGHLDALAFLLQRGANILAKDNEGSTALHFAAAENNLFIIDTLIKEYGLNVNSISYRAQTPLHYAAARGQIDAINHLIELGADKNALDSSGKTALHRAAQKGRSDAIAVLITRHHFDPNAVDNERKTPLHLAAEFGTYAAVTELIKHHADPRALSQNGLSVLHYAAKNDKTAIIASLIKDHGFNPNYTVDHARHSVPSTLATSLGMAITKSSCLAIFALRNLGAELTKNEKIRHKYHSDGCLSGFKTDADKTVVLDALISESLAPWDPNIIDPRDHSTALIRAAKKKCLNCVLFLLKDRRTNPNIQDKDKKTALHYALEYDPLIFSSAICIRLLNLRRTNVGIQDINGDTPRAILNTKVKGDHKHTLEEKIINAFELRKMHVQAYLSLKNARCSEQCSEKVCTHLPQLPADVCFKIVGMLTEESLP